MDFHVDGSSWGISASEGLWPVTLRILVVIDGRILLNRSPANFGLGYVLDILRASWSWWVRFDVDIATREECVSEAASGGNTVAFTAFKFTCRDFNIDDYDQIWFFADQPNGTDGSDQTVDADILPPYTLDDDELVLLANWMDRGGGVFATGDHGVLGASLCSRIPRVRTMRRWKRSQDVPSVGGRRRNQTLQPNPAVAGDEFLQEGDTLLQPVELVYSQAVGHFPFMLVKRPHPLMCSNRGPIDRFPDHMHEGELIPDESVVLNEPLGIPGYDRPEYPVIPPEVLASGDLDVGGLRRQPRPRIIAYGRTTNPYFPDIPDTVSTVAALTAGTALGSKRFGLVSVYDGDSVNVGRVVCDSTWHHWLSVNLAGIAEGDDFAYRKVQSYYRNVGLWLATPAQRQAVLIAGVWGVLVGTDPMRITFNQSAWEMGEHALAVLRHTFSPCWIGVLSGSFLEVESLTRVRTPEELPPADPYWSGLSEELVNRAVVGSICKALKPMAFAYRRECSKYDHVRVDEDAIRRQAGLGAKQARELLRHTLDDAVTSLAALRDKIPERRGDCEK